MSQRLTDNKNSPTPSHQPPLRPAHPPTPPHTRTFSVSWPRPHSQGLCLRAPLPAYTQACAHTHTHTRGHTQPEPDRNSSGSQSCSEPPQSALPQQETGDQRKFMKKVGGKTGSPGTLQSLPSKAGESSLLSPAAQRSSQKAAFRIVTLYTRSHVLSSKGCSHTLGITPSPPPGGQQSPQPGASTLATRPEEQGVGRWSSSISRGPHLLPQDGAVLRGQPAPRLP